MSRRSVIVRKGWEGVKKGLQRTTEVHSRFAGFGFGAIHVCGYYLLNPGRLGIIQIMNARRKPFHFVVHLVWPLFLAAPLFMQTSVTSQSNQQRPRTVGSNQNSNRPAPTPPPMNTNSAAEEVDEGDVVRVETQLVTVPAVVTDRTGHPIPTLRQENFAVFEDGKPQRLTNFATTDAPFEIALLLDTSGSTREELGLIRDAANAFISALRPGDRIAVVAFNNEQSTRGPIAIVDVLSALTDKRTVLRNAIANVRTSNGTPFYDAQN